jgi:mono/diheme cytochrome c family protein
MNPRSAAGVNGKSAMGRRPFPISHFLFPLLLFPLTSCEWFTDFRRQPKIDPWESSADSIPPRANPQFSVPTHGSSAPGFAYGRQASIASVDSMSRLTNPVTADARSLRTGQQQYQINCAVCHGALGAGDGPVTRFGFPPLAIGAGSRAAGQLSDGYLFGIIRNGRGLMPPYNRIEEQERWDLINYLRAMQGGSAGAAGVVGRPGETGNLVPGPSLTAPTRPAPFYRAPIAGSPGGPTQPSPSQTAPSAQPTPTTGPDTSARSTPRP